MSEARADRILVADRVWKARGRDGGGQAAGPEAVAIRGGRILAIGEERELEPLCGTDTSVLRLPGHTLLPGFVDAHVHLLEGGLLLSRVDLRGAGSPEELVRRVAAGAAAAPPGAWILGGGWNHHAWGGGLPHRSWLDRACPYHPVFLLRQDLHIGVANGIALEAAGVAESTPDPDGGTIDREADGRTPTGILRERALESVRRVVPPPSAAERTAALRAALAHAASHGVTQVHDMAVMEDAAGSWASLDVLRGLDASGELPIRVLAALPLGERGPLADLLRAEGPGDSRLRWGLVKGFVDGSLGASTAWFHEPYLGDGGHRGAPAGDLEELRIGILEAEADGLRVAVHAIGDRAVDWLIGVYAEADARGGRADVPLRIEHAQHLRAEAFAKLAGPRVVCSVQPAHLSEDARWLEGRLGPERARRAYALRTMAAAGARLAFGSDWPVAPLDPAAALDAAVLRRMNPRSSGDVWNLREALRVETALEAYTLGGALAGGSADETGSLQAGKRADLVAVRGDPLAWDEGEHAGGLEVSLTVVDGIDVWRRGGGPEAGEA